MKVNDLGLLEPSWEASWSALWASWRPLGPSWGHLGRLGALLGRLGGLLGLLGHFLGPSLPVMEPFGLRKSHAGTPKSAQECHDAWALGPGANLRISARPQLSMLEP